MDQRTLFEKIDRTLIEEWIAEGKEENLHFEFKSSASTDCSTGSDRSNLAKALSAFANSDGGIILWGIRTKKDVNGVERASTSALISDCRLFNNKLNELTGDATTPLVEGVIHKVIQFDGSQGCVATFIPPSQTGPHMAKFGENRYYKRAGHKLYPMEHFDILDMLGRRQRPKLELILTCSESDFSESVKLSIRMKNSGRALAKHAGFFLKFLDSDVEVTQQPPPKIQNVSNINDGTVAFYFAADGEVYHPTEASYLMAELHLRKPATGKFNCLSSVFCEHMPERRCVVQIGL